MAARVDLPAKLQSVVQQVGSPVTSEDVDSYGKLQHIRDQTYRVRTIIKAWKDQQAQDRALRERYAKWLMLAMAVQALVINVVYVLMGCKVLVFEEWTARTFIIGVFAEIAALVFVVLKYLFSTSGVRILRDLEKLNRTP